MTRGPAPKREDQRRRKNVSPVPVTKAAAGSVAVIPDADPDWHPFARRWYEGLARSGQSAFYEVSDWDMAVIAAESISRELNPKPMIVAHEVVLVEQPPTASALAAFRSTCAALLVAEGDRRRARLELERDEGAPEEVTSIDRYRRRLGSTG